MADSFLNGDEYIRTFNYTQSYISIWDPSNVLNVTSWQWKSNGKPKGINRVIAVSSDA